jgi:hypothetical protein
MANTSGRNGIYGDLCILRLCDDVLMLILNDNAIKTQLCKLRFTCRKFNELIINRVALGSDMFFDLFRANLFEKKYDNIGRLLKSNNPTKKFGYLSTDNVCNELLLYASAMNDTDAMRLLLTDARISAHTKIGQPMALGFALMYRNVQMVKMMLDCSDGDAVRSKITPLLGMLEISHKVDYYFVRILSKSFIKNLGSKKCAEHHSRSLFCPNCLKMVKYECNDFDVLTKEPWAISFNMALNSTTKHSQGLVYLFNNFWNIICVAMIFKGNNNFKEQQIDEAELEMLGNMLLDKVTKKKSDLLKNVGPVFAYAGQDNHTGLIKSMLGHIPGAEIFHYLCKYWGIVGMNDDDSGIGHVVCDNFIWACTNCHIDILNIYCNKVKTMELDKIAKVLNNPNPNESLMRHVCSGTSKVAGKNLCRVDYSKMLEILVNQFGINIEQHITTYIQEAFINEEMELMEVLDSKMEEKIKKQGSSSASSGSKLDKGYIITRDPHGNITDVFFG